MSEADRESDGERERQRERAPHTCTPSAEGEERAEGVEKTDERREGREGSVRVGALSLEFLNFIEASAKKRSRLPRASRPG